MKYIIVDINEQREGGLQHDIADFLWNNGNEVYIKDYCATDFINIVKDCNCIILLVYNLYTSDFFLDKVLERFKHDFELEGLQKTKTVVVFSNTGVYSNSIPFPHKIFQFKQLNRQELIRFFKWSKTHHLFER